MESNAPLERLINTVMALDGIAAESDCASEMRCLMRKIEWAAAEAEATLARCAQRTAGRSETRSSLQDAA